MLFAQVRRSLQRRSRAVDSNLPFSRRSSSKTPTPSPQMPPIQGPGAKEGSIGSDYEQAVGVERLELLSKLAGRSIFSSSEPLKHPRGETFKGTMSDPVIVETLAGPNDSASAMERIVGCSGVPRGSHEIGFFWVRSHVECTRCPECGQAFKLDPILKE